MRGVLCAICVTGALLAPASAALVTERPSGVLLPADVARDTPLNGEGGFAWEAGLNSNKAVAQVPVPSALWLFPVGVLGLLLLRRTGVDPQG